jgi:chromosomal replication initiation ATPase DnaA
MPAEDVRLCRKCGAQLSKYNPTGQCFRHDQQALLQKLEVVPKHLEPRQGLENLVVNNLGAPLPERTPEKVLAFIAERYGVSEDELRNHSRIPKLVLPRQILMYILRNELKMSLPDIGRFLGRDHSTILYACEKISGRLAADPELNQEVNLVRQSMEKKLDN